MPQPQTIEQPPVHNEVLVTTRGLVVVKMHGPQDVGTVRALGKELIGHAAKLAEHNKKMTVYIDIKDLSNTAGSSDARLEAKRLLSEIPAEAIAVVGLGAVGTTLQYMFRVAGVSRRAHFFTSERKARAWLDDVGRPQHKPLNVGLIAGIVIGLIGITVLVGWQINNDHLTHWMLDLNPMNPVAAVGLVAVGVAFICHWARQIRVLRYLAVGGVVLGVSAILPFRIDNLLYGDKVTAIGAHAQIADSAAICFIAIGIVGLILGRKARWVRIGEYTAATVIGVLSLCNIFGQLYAHDFIFSIGGGFVMAYSLAVAFSVASAGFFILITYHQLDKNILMQLNRATWLIILSLTVLQGVTYAAWQQAVARNESESRHALTLRMDSVQALTSSRLQAYTNSIKGFTGLFAASDYVSQKDFTNYYNSLDLTKNYPGLQSIIYITAVKDNEINAFVAKQRQNNPPFNGRPFTISRQTTLPEHFIFTYTATGANTSAGIDLSSIPGREQLYTAALNSDGVFGSGTVTVPAVTVGNTPYQGFFITAPVSNSNQPRGIVNAVLRYEVFFASLFSDSELLEDVDIKITDGTNGSIVYTSDKNSGEQAYTDIGDVPIANRNWAVAISANKDFGIGVSQSRLPSLVIVVGQAFTVFLFLLFFSQWRARKQALDLADTITQDLQIERNKAVANERNRAAILASIGDGVFAVDTQRRLTLLNPAAQAISGEREEDSIGKPYDQVLRFELERTGKINDRFITRALDGHLASMTNHTVLVRKDGRLVPVADSAAPIHDAQGKVIGAIVVFRDVSKDYDLDKAKSEFVSLASHQLRTPLSAVNWYGEMLLNGDAGKLNKGQHEYIKEIFEGSQRMVELVNALLDVSRIEVGKLANQPESIDMVELINSLEKELATFIETKHLHVTKHLEAVPKITADPKQLRMIAQNLMSNAAKYTDDKGSIAISLRLAKAKDIKTAGLHSSEPHLMFVVKDDGYGIPKEQHAKVFGKLFRADNVRKLDVEGTGLGLYIVKEVVKKMGGRVWFESTEGEGATFYVVLPINPKHGK